VKFVFLKSDFQAAVWTVGSSIAQAATIDIQQTDRSVFIASFGQNDLAQRFTAVSENSTGAGIFAQSSSIGTLTISLFDALPNAGGSLLASGQATLSGNTWVDVFWNEVPTTPGLLYYLVFDSDNTSGGINSSIGNPYADGIAFANTDFSPFTQFDYAFRTYTGQAAVPLPAAGWMFVTVLAAVPALRRFSFNTLRAGQSV